MMKLSSSPHRRFNPLTGDWVLVSPQRTMRPWQGKIEKTDAIDQPAYDPACYLCPGNKRAYGATNPDYKTTLVFINDFSALLPGVPQDIPDEYPLLAAKSERGICKVICYSPRHDLSLGLMEKPAIELVILTWISEFVEIGKNSWISHVQIFENRGSVMGCSNSHPHGQIWANQTIPLITGREGEHQSLYFKETKRCLLCDYAALELKQKERIVLENDSFWALVPFWAVWPFETMIVPKNHHASIEALAEKEIVDLAGILQGLIVRYDNLFLAPFPFSMGIHQKPTDATSHPEWHFHFHFYPPLLRSATVQKFMVGYEMLAQPQRDITAESAAERLRSLPHIHYTKT